MVESDESVYGGLLDTLNMQIIEKNYSKSDLGLNTSHCLLNWWNTSIQVNLRRFLYSVISYWRSVMIYLRVIQAIIK